MSMRDECFTCIHRGRVIGSCHSTCRKPDPNMTGEKHGIKNGWFMYPYNFDPVWKTKDCANYESGEYTNKSSSESSSETPMTR